MDDKQLLERAARAAGIELMWSSEPDMPPRKADDWENWQPLKDDGDAFRLAVEVGLLKPEHNALLSNLLREEQRRRAPAEAARRAIVRAAAAMAGEE